MNAGERRGTLPAGQLRPTGSVVDGSKIWCQNPSRQAPQSPSDVVVMTQIIEIRKADDPRDVIHRACQLLAEGHLVAFPTETAYVAAAGSLSGAGVDRLRSVSSGEAVLALKSPHEAHDYVPNMPSAADKLARRAWPGPLTMEFETSALNGLYHSIPATTRQLLLGDRSAIALRVPAHEAILNVQQLCPAPLVVTSDRSKTSPLARTAAEAAQLFGEDVALVIDDGPCRYGEPTTTIRFSGERWDLVHQGMISARNIDRLVSEIYLFVCTGNTCRSPMAEALFRRRLSERLQCQEDDLMDRGFAVLSAGLSAGVGGQASPEAVAAWWRCKNNGGSDYDAYRALVASVAGK